MKPKTKTPTIDMVTWQGHAVNFLKPEDTIVDWEDLKVHTKNICRYNGALDWKLMEHLALCSRLSQLSDVRERGGFTNMTEEEVTLQAGYCSTHDFQEIYCTDVVSGLKKYLPAYREIEDTWESYVHQQIGLPLCHRNHKFVRHIDLRALVVEMTALEHPAAKLVGERYGGPVLDSEKEAFDAIYKHRSWAVGRNCNWEIITKAYSKAQQIYIKRKGYEIEVY